MIWKFKLFVLQIPVMETPFPSLYSHPLSSCLPPSALTSIVSSYIQYLALALRVLPLSPPCQHAGHAAERWAERFPFGPSEAPSSPSPSLTVQCACPPPTGQEPHKTAQIRTSDSLTLGQTTLHNFPVRVTGFIVHTSTCTQTCWRRESLLPSDCSSCLLTLSSSCSIWGLCNRKKNNVRTSRSAVMLWTLICCLVRFMQNFQMCTIYWFTFS